MRSHSNNILHFNYVFHLCVDCVTLQWCTQIKLPKKIFSTYTIQSNSPQTMVTSFIYQQCVSRFIRGGMGLLRTTHVLPCCELPVRANAIAISVEALGHALIALLQQRQMLKTTFRAVVS